jgi:hypothetical protein
MSLTCEQTGTRFHLGSNAYLPLSVNPTFQDKDPHDSFS